MSEWLKEHAWKTIWATITKRYSLKHLVAHSMQRLAVKRPEFVGGQLV